MGLYYTVNDGIKIGRNYRPYLVQPSSNEMLLPLDKLLKFCYYLLSMISLTKISKLRWLSKKTLISAAIICFLIFGVLYFKIHLKRSSDNNAAVKPTPEAIINLNGPTEKERQSSESAKSNILNQEKIRNSTPTTTESGKRSVTPTITYAGQYGSQIEVGGYVGSVFEDGGTCTLTLQKGTYQKTNQVIGIKGASSVDCPVMTFSLSSLEPGTYQATLSYISLTSEGQSTSRTVEIK